MPPIIRVPPIYDISHWVEVPNFRALDPMAWLILTKATEGTAYLDPTYAIYSKEIRAAGIRLGAYHFMRPGDELSQADWFCEVVRDNGLNGDEVLALDLEVGGINLEQCKRFMDRVQQKTGIRPILYSTQLQIESLYPIPNTPPAWLENEWLWIAEYTEPASNNEIPPYIVPAGCSASRIALWQYSDKGVIGGTGNNVDLNIISGEFIAHIGLQEPDKGETPMSDTWKVTWENGANRRPAPSTNNNPVPPPLNNGEEFVVVEYSIPNGKTQEQEYWGKLTGGLWVALTYNSEPRALKLTTTPPPTGDLQVGLSITVNQQLAELKVNGETWKKA